MNPQIAHVSESYICVPWIDRPSKCNRVRHTTAQRSNVIESKYSVHLGSYPVVIGSATDSREPCKSWKVACKDSLVWAFSLNIPCTQQDDHKGDVAMGHRIPFGK